MKSAVLSTAMTKEIFMQEYDISAAFERKRGCLKMFFQFILLFAQFIQKFSSRL
jgi:hypothetical protein